MPQCQVYHGLYRRFGRRLKAFREERMKTTGMTRNEFVEQAGISKKQLKAMEAGKITDEHLQELHDICRAHGLDIHYLVENDETIAARHRELEELLWLLAEDRRGMYEAYRQLLTRMQEPGIERFIFIALDRMIAISEDAKSGRPGENRR